MKIDDEGVSENPHLQSVLLQRILHPDSQYLIGNRHQMMRILHGEEAERGIW